MTDDGIWGHSRPAKEHIVFALVSTNNVEQNSILAATQIASMFAAFAQDHDIAFKPVIGQYTMRDTGEKVTETCALCSSEHFEIIKEHGWFDEEESVLFLRDQDARDRRRAVLRFLEDGREEEIGFFGSIRKEELDGQDFTYDPSTDTLFVCKTQEEWHQRHIKSSNAKTRD